MTTAAQRREIGCLLDYLVAHEPCIHYGEVRPITRCRSIAQLEQLVREHGWTTDCSGSTTTIFEAVGLKDPNGRGFDGEGNTQTMYNHLPRYTNPKGAGVGALAWFGVPGELETQHVTIVRHPGPDPVLFSHGQEKGPLYLPWSVERRYHEGEAVFLNISRL